MSTARLLRMHKLPTLVSPPESKINIAPPSSTLPDTITKPEKKKFLGCISYFSNETIFMPTGDAKAALDVQLSNLENELIDKITFTEDLPKAATGLGLKFTTFMATIQVGLNLGTTETSSTFNTVMTCIVATGNFILAVANPIFSKINDNAKDALATAQEARAALRSP